MQQNYKIFVSDFLIEFALPQIHVDSPAVAIFQIENSEGASLVNDLTSLFLHFDKNKFRKRFKLNDDQFHLIIEITSPKEIWESFIEKFKILDAAGGIVENPEAEKLLIFRMNFWDLPKGKIDPGETIKQAAVREVIEETAAEVTDCANEVFTVTHHFYKENRQGFIKRSYWFKMKASGPAKLIPQTEEQISKAIWANDYKIKGFYPQMYPSIRYVFDQLFYKKFK